MKEIEKMIWAACFAREYQSAIKKSSVGISDSGVSADEREKWQIEQASNAAIWACEAVCEFREIGGALFNKDFRAYLMHMRLLNELDDD